MAEKPFGVKKIDVYTGLDLDGYLQDGGGDAGNANQVLISTGGVSPQVDWVDLSALTSNSGSTGISFTDLNDTPSEYATDPSDANKYVKVNSNADGLIFDGLTTGDVGGFDAAVNNLIVNNNSIPYANITGEPTHTFLGLTDTPSAYNNGKLLVSTLTGIDFTDTMTITKLVVSGPLVEKFTRESGSNVGLDLRDGNVFQLVLGSSTTSVAFTNCPASSGEAYAFTLIVSNTAADVSINWPNTIKWAGDTGDSNYVPTRTKATGKSDVWVFTTYDGGTTWLGVIASFGYDSLPTS